MQWAIDNIRQLRTTLVVVGGILVIGNLALGPDPVNTRIAAVASLVIVVPFLYFGMRWTLRLQIWQHGLRPWIVEGATLAFYFFGIAAVAGLSLVVSGLGSRTPFAAMFIGPAVFSYSAAETVRRSREEGARL